MRKVCFQFLVAAAALVTMLPGHSQQLMDRIVAVANEDVVTANELARRTDRVRQQYQSNPQVLPPAEQLQRQILDAMILERLQLQLAQSINLSVTDSQVNQAINNLARQQNMTLEQFITALQNSGENFASVREQIRNEITIGQVRRQFVGRNINVSDGEVERYLRTLAGQNLQETRFELLYRRFELSEQNAAEALKAELDNGASLANDDQARNLGLRQVDELPSLFRTVVPVLNLGESVLIEQGGAFHLAQLVDKIERQAVQVRQYRVRHILIEPNAILTGEQTQTLLNELRQQIQQGADMAELANQYTDDLGSKGNGGDLGWRQADEFAANFAQQVRAMPEGEISPVFQTQFGYHILRIEGERTEDVALDVLRDQVRNTLGERKFNEALQRWLVELRAQSFVEVRL
ncbi:MAG: peptidylprolyl isomerase [Saccharospirillum sp.]